VSGQHPLSVPDSVDFSALVTVRFQTYVTRTHIRA
jgi:hypothetical protein